MESISKIPALPSAVIEGEPVARRAAAPTTVARRRLLLGAAGVAATAAAVSGCATTGGGSAGRVVVVGGGYGGATAAKYVRLFRNARSTSCWSSPNSSFVSCPISNLVLGGARQIGDITVPYDEPARHGVRIVARHGGLDRPRRQEGAPRRRPRIRYDKLVLSPGVDLMFDDVAGLREAQRARHVLHAWKAGPETMALRRQIEAMRRRRVCDHDSRGALPLPAGAVRARQRGRGLFEGAKPKSKVLILDANPEVTSRAPLFKKRGPSSTARMVEYRGQHKTTAVDAQAKTIEFEVQDDVKADVLNVLPPMRAGDIAVQSGLATANARWCQVNYQTFESTAAKDIYVLGDAIQIAPAMPKSGHMANSHAKVAAAAIVARAEGLGREREADAHEHLLQLREPGGGDPRRERPRVRGGGEDVQDRRRARRRVGRAERRRRRDSRIRGRATSGPTCSVDGPNSSRAAGDGSRASRLHGLNLVVIADVNDVGDRGPSSGSAVLGLLVLSGPGGHRAFDAPRIDPFTLRPRRRLRFRARRP